MNNTYGDHVDTEAEEKLFEQYESRLFPNGTADYDNASGREDFEQGRLFIRKHEEKKALECFERSAKLGCADGQFYYGMMLMDGVGCEAEPLEACFWYRKAIERGNAYAMVNLGECYRTGTGVRENSAKTLYWFARAAYELFPDGVHNLGYYLRYEEAEMETVGQNLLDAVAYLDREDVCEYVKKIAEIILCGS